MNIYTITNTRTIKICANNKVSALKYAAEHPELWEEEQDVEIKDGKVLNTKKRMLSLLKTFHGSDCEREFLNVSKAYWNSRSAGMRAMADFVEKGEYKNYGGEIEYEWSTDPVLSLHVKGCDRYYGVGRRHDIEDDMAKLEKDIAELEKFVVS